MIRFRIPAGQVLLGLGLIAGGSLGWLPSPGSGQELRIATFNIRYGSAADGANAWPLRRDLLADVVREMAPDIMGVQEALRFQLDELTPDLGDLAWVGVGRDDGVDEGEFAPIYYRGDRVDLLESGTFWFSDTPAVPGSKSWGNDLPRISTWARFRDLESGRTVIVLNLHWDHQSQPSRERSAQLLLRRARELADSSDGIVITGDFNAGENNPAFRALVESTDPRLKDSFRELHPGAGGGGTFHGFQGGVDGEKIDAVLVGPGWRVLEASIVHNSREGRYPSDHYPVLAVLEWDESRNPTEP